MPTQPTIPSYLSAADARHADIELPPRGAWPAAIHRLDADQAAALRAAEAAGRPLLVRGLPGVGKSQLARAAAVAARRRFVWAVIDGRTEALDLQWRFDAVQRLADAQSRAGTPLPPANYVSAGPLWAAFNWQTAALRHQQQSGVADSLPDWMDAEPWRAGPDAPATAPSDDKVVLLLDEIDKADADLPNALLEALSGNGFTPTVPGVPAVQCDAAQRPLIILTTNEERELPPAFLRRCFVIELALPQGDDSLCLHLMDLAGQHQRYLVRCGQRQPDQVCSPTVLQEAAQALLLARQDARAQQAYVPATAEYLDLVRALATLFPADEAAQREHLKLLQTYALKKWVRRG